MSRVPTVSIVVPTYDNETTIGATIRSVLAQSYRDFELLVSDDGSADGTVSQVERIDDPRVRILRNDHGGASVARNHGIAQARGRYVSFLDSDDLWLPSYLDAMTAALAAAPDAGFAFTDAWVMDDATRRIRKTSVVRSPTAVNPPLDPAEFLTSLIRINFVFTSATVRRQVLDDVGGFDESLEASIDYELWLRIAASGRPGTRVPGRHALYRADRPGSISSSRARVVRGLMAVYRLVAESYPVGESDQLLALQLLAEKTKEYESLIAGDPFRSRWPQLKAHLIGVRDGLLRREGWYGTPPAELVVAFPELLGAQRAAPRG